MSSRLRLFFTVAVLVSLPACGGGDGGPTPPVAAPVASVSVTPDGQSISPTQTLQFAAALRDAAGNALTGRATTWSATPASVGSVSATGLVTAIAPGALTVTATSEGKSGSAQLTIVSNSAVATIVVTSPTQTLIPQGTAQLAVVLKDAAGNALSGRSIAWTATPTTVGSVSSNGVVTAIALGTLTVTATSEGRSANVTLAVVSGAMVGPTGGTLTLSGGEVEVQVPAGAVSANTMITSVPVSAPSVAQPTGWQTVGQQYALGPVGTTFAQPVTVKFKFKSSDLPAFAMSGDLKLRQASAGQWSSLSSVVIDATNKTISARTTTFGTSTNILANARTGFGVEGFVEGFGVTSVNQLQAPEPTTGISAQDPTITLTPGKASVNAQQRSVTFIVSITPNGTGVPLPANTPAPQYRWTTTGRNGVLSASTAWTTATDAQYTATNAVLNQLTGPIDDVKVELLLNPGETDPAKQRIVSATATVDADLDKTYEILPSLPVVAPSESKNMQLFIRDKQGVVQALPITQSLTWTTSGVFGNIGTPGPRQETITYRANSTFSNPPPRVDDVVVKVTEVRNTVTRVFHQAVFGSDGAYDEQTVTRTVNIAEKKEFVEVKVNYQINITPAAPKIAATGNTPLTVSITPAYDGPGLMYKWTNPGVYGTLNVANGTRIASPTVTYTSKGTGGGTDQLKVDVVSVVAGVELETIGSAVVNVAVDPAKLAWHITSFTLLSVTGSAPNDCSDLCFTLTRFETRPQIGFFFAFPTALATPLSPVLPTPGFHVLTNFAPDTVTNYPTNGNGLLSILHRFNASYDGSRPASGTFNYTGDAVSGAISGSATPLYKNPFLPYDYRATLTATKDGDTLTGEVEVVVSFTSSQTGSTNPNWVTKKWRFTAVRLP